MENLLHCSSGSQLALCACRKGMGAVRAVKVVEFFIVSLKKLLNLKVQV